MIQTHPAMAAALTEQHIRTMIAEADAARLACAARDRGIRGPVRWFLPRRHPGNSGPAYGPGPVASRPRPLNDSAKSPGLQHPGHGAELPSGSKTFLLGLNRRHASSRT
jgi:hypothetical protein